MATMRTLKSISRALELVEDKKTKLKKAFEQLQTQSSLLSSSSSNLRWDEIDSHFTSLYSNLIHKFSLIKSLEESQQNKPKLVLGTTEKPNPDSTRPELKSFCEKMDGLGLRKYILDKPNQRDDIRAELAGAWKHASDPAELVLNSMDGFFRDVPGSGADSGTEVRKVCLFLLEEFMKVSGIMEIGVEAKEKARALAAEWKKNKRVVVDNDNGDDDEDEGMEKLGFLFLLGVFGLVDDNVGEFEMNEVIEYAVGIARFRQAVELCRVLGFGERISEVVNKLIGKGEQLIAVKFILHFELTEKFPPLPLLDTYISRSKELTDQAGEKGKNYRQNLNYVAGKEIISLKSILKYIKEHNLESKYPKDSLWRCIKSLERVKNDRKRSAAGHAPKARQPLKKQKMSLPKRSRRNGAAGPSRIHRTVTANATSAPLPQHYVQAAGLLTDPYAAYGLAGSRPAAITYEGASTGVYGLSGTPTGYSANQNPSMSGMYPSEPHVQPSYYDNRSLVYGGHSMPSQYHPAYYPQ